MTPEEERRHLVEQLREYAQDVLSEWMRLVELTDVDGIDFQARLRWEDHQGACVLGYSQYSDELGAFRITVNVEDLGLLPPLGPENDPAASAEEEPQWVRRTWADVVAGDTVRPPGFPDVVAHVSARYRSVSEDPAGEKWHVVAGSGHWSDHAVRPGEVWVVLDQETDPRCMERTAPVEIRLTPSEVAAIELLGWENRVEQR